jgi:hypothetical protein
MCQEAESRFSESSGSIVVSRPRDVVVANGQLLINKEGKQFAFLGIFSGEPIQQHHPIELDDMTIIRKSGYNVGVVWYGHLVKDIVSQGIHYQATTA